VSAAAGEPAGYRVSYSGRVRQRVVELAAVARARARGDGEEYLAALQEFDRRLRVYPQFGDPLVDLLAEAGQVRLGAVPPLAMRYGVLEEQKLVLVAAPPVLLARRVGG
jgi:hypothetical protein